MGIVDVRTQGVERHATFTVPFGTRDLGTAETTCEVHTDTKGTHTHGVLYRALHGAAERHPAFQLLCNAFTNKGCIQLGLAHFNDVEVQLGRCELRQFLAQTFDVRTFLADDHTGACCVDRDAALFVRTLDDHTGDTRLVAFFLDELADGEIFQKKVPEILGIGVPTAIPRAVNLKAHADWIDFVTHYACSST